MTHVPVYGIADDQPVRRPRVRRVLYAKLRRSPAPTVLLAVGLLGLLVAAPLGATLFWQVLLGLLSMGALLLAPYLQGYRMQPTKLFWNGEQ